MDLDKMKEIWSEMSDQLEKQKKLTNQIILKMTQERSNNRLNKLINFEIIGSIISVGLIVLVIANFDKLGNGLMLTAGIVSIIIFVMSTLTSLNFIKKAKKIDVVKNSYKQTLIDFATCYKTYQIHMKLSTILGIVMVFVFLPVVAKILSNKDILSDLEEFWESLIACSIILPVVWYIIYKFYSRNMEEVNRLLKDLEE
jgi:hypothetical protein